MSHTNLHCSITLHEKEIRLLRLHPSHAFDAPINCDIFITNLDSELQPIYQALSYTWEDPTETSHIFINGIDNPVKCGLSLSSALRHVRHETDAVVLWVDAICINQSDMMEREHQVRMMGLVYNKAEKVTAWLGEETKDSQLAMQLLDTLPSYKLTPDLDPRKPYDYMQTLFKAIPLIFDIDANRALLALSARPYWSRAWIFQELTLAQQADVKCGNISITLDRLKKAASALRGLTFFINIVDAESISNNLRLVREFWQRLRRKAMLNLISSTAKWRMHRPSLLQVLPQQMMEYLVIRKATDPRDLVFSLFGFLDPNSPHSDLIQPLYSKSTEEVYQDFARYLITTTGTLSALNANVISASVQGRTSLPSWVPDWRIRGWHTSPHDEKDIHPCNPITSFVEFSSNGRVLSAKGFQIGAVTTICHNAFTFMFLDSGARKEHSCQYQQDFLNQILEGPPVNGETSLSAFIRLCSRRSGSDSEEIDTEDSVRMLTALFYATVPRENAAESIQTLLYWVTRFLGDRTTVEETQKLMNSILNNRIDTLQYKNLGDGDKHAMFRTDAGLMGVGPEWMAKGDILCQLAAHSRPFLLRPVGEQYRNVGECLVLDLGLLQVTEISTPQMKVFQIE